MKNQVNVYGMGLLGLIIFVLCMIWWDIGIIHTETPTGSEYRIDFLPEDPPLYKNWEN